MALINGIEQRRNAQFWAETVRITRAIDVCSCVQTYSASKLRFLHAIDRPTKL